MKSSDSFDAVRASAIDIDAALLRSQAPLDWRFSGLVGRLVNENEPQSPFQPAQNLSTQYSLGVAKLFQTGTTASLQLTHANTDLAFLQAIDPLTGQNSFAFYESAFEARISQNLWANAFGSGTRSLLAAGESQKEAAKFAFQDQVEQWALELMDIFYQAWLAQVQAKAALEDVERRERLARVTQIKLRRGTSEQPDRLQVDSAVLASKVRLTQARETLLNRWRSLVISLKLPDAWLKIDPILIPIELNEPSPSLLSSCSESQREQNTPSQPSASQAAVHQAKAAASLAEQAYSSARPDLDLELALRSNGIDSLARGDTFGETLAVNHPSWALQLKLQFPLSFSAEKAQALSATAQRERAEALAAQAQSFVRLNWINACSDLLQSKTTVELLQKAYENQRRRERLEEERFGIGRSTTFQIIQAGDDAALAETQLNTAQVQYRMAAWRVQRFSDGLKGYLESLMKRQDLVQ